jgi:hypothetical protein
MSDLPILTKATTEIAAKGAHRQNISPRIIMIERLFFNGIDS